VHGHYPRGVNSTLDKHRKNPTNGSTAATIFPCYSCGWTSLYCLYFSCCKHNEWHQHKQIQVKYALTFTWIITQKLAIFILG